jgi:SAM-dependent methyltransferase
MVWQRFAAGDEVLTQLYGRWARARSDPGRDDSVRQVASRAQEILTALEYFGRRPSEVAMLDFGAGWGRWSRIAAAFGCRSFAIEISEEQQAFIAASGIELLDLDALPASTFQFVNSEQSFEHLVEPFETLERLAASLAPDGLIKISVPNAASVMQALGAGDWRARSLNPVAPLEHLNGFTPRALEAMAIRAGLRRARIPLGDQYAAQLGWRPVRGFARSLVTPVVRNYRRRTTMLFTPG